MIERELQKRQLPDLFLSPNGERITVSADWERIMRPYWKSLLLREVYGQMPPYVKPEVIGKYNPVTFGGKAVWEEIAFHFTWKEKTHTVPAQLIYPADKKTSPFFIYLNFRPDIPDRYLPVEEIIDHGFGVFVVHYNDITKDNGDFTDGLAGLFSAEKRAGEHFGKISCWAYMASHMMDYLITRPEADPKAIGIAGHSRLGKTALLAAAMDERFAFVCANESGCSGAALARGCAEGAESVRNICEVFPYWFCPNYLQYMDCPEAMPVDQHCLLALIAPRAVYIGGALDDTWCGNDNQFLACAAASPVWELYGKQGLATPDRMPECGDILTDGYVGFHLRAGSHFHSRTDWLVYMDAVKRILECK